MRQMIIGLLATAAAASLGSLLLAQAARGPATSPHALDAAQDARFGMQYSYNIPSALPAPAAYPDKASWDARADFLRHQVAVAQGLWPMPEKTPLHAVIHGKVEKEDFTIEKVYFQSTPGHYVTGNLYRPLAIKPGAKVPAVLMPYGHWGTAPNNGRFWWRTDAEIQTEMTSGGERSVEAARSPLQETCMNLAHMGCVVFEWDLVGYCDSSVIKHQEGFTDTAAVMRLQSFMGLQTWNGIRAMDFVLSLPEVDAGRVCIAGSSGGATQTMQLGATDSRIAATFAMVMVDVHMQGGCICENAPLLRVGTNNVEIASLSAPRPQGDCGASADNSRDYETNGFPFMQHVYDLLGAKENAQAFTVTAGHNHNVHSRELLYSFVNRTFKLGVAEPIVEKPMPAVPVAQLSVWDAAHPLPADFVDAKTLRAAMSKASDDQIAGLDLPAYRATLKTALQAMVDDALPQARDVESTMTPGWVAKAGAWRGTIGRKDAGEKIPCAYIKPANWNGTVVIWADEKGAAAILDAAGEPTAQAAKVTASGAMIMGIDTFMSDAFKRATALGNPVGMRNNYSAYANGYERTTLANRVHDLLTAIAMAKGMPGAKSIRIVGIGEAGVQTLLAAGLAGEAVDRVAVDLAGFDFDRVTDDRNVNLLPGAVKYGGIYGFATLCANPKEKTLLCGVPQGTKIGRLTQTPEVTVDMKAYTLEQLGAWVLE